MPRRTQKPRPVKRGGHVARRPRPQHATAYRAMCARMKGWRLEAGVLQVEVARRMRLTQAQVAKIESGDRRIDPIEFAAWCRAVGVTPADGMERLGV